MLDLHKESNDLQSKQYQGIFLTTMLAYLVNCNKFVANIYMENISDMKYQRHHINLEKNDMKNLRNQLPTLMLTLLCL